MSGSASPPSRWFSGPLGTRLLAQGMESESLWLAPLERAERIAGLHRQDLEAGANHLLLSTFSAWVRADEERDVVERVLQRAVQLGRRAREALGRWDSVKLVAPLAPLDPRLDPVLAGEGLRHRAECLIESGVEELRLETQVQVHASEQAIDTIAPLAQAAGIDWSLSLVPGSEAAKHTERLFARAAKESAHALGFNCANVPACTQAARAIAPGSMLDLCPSLGPQALGSTGAHGTAAKELLRVASEFPRVRLGWCCGGDSGAIQALRDAAVEA